MNMNVQRLQATLGEITGSSSLFRRDNRHNLQSVLQDFFNQSVHSRALFKRLYTEHLRVHGTRGRPPSKKECVRLILDMKMPKRRFRSGPLFVILFFNLLSLSFGCSFSFFVSFFDAPGWSFGDTTPSIPLLHSPATTIPGIHIRHQESDTFFFIHILHSHNHGE